MKDSTQGKTKNNKRTTWIAISAAVLLFLIYYLAGTLNILERIPSPMPSPYYRSISMYTENRTYYCGTTIMFSYGYDYHSSKSTDEIQEYYENQMKMDCVDEPHFENCTKMRVCDNFDCLKYEDVLECSETQSAQCKLPDYSLWSYFPNVEKQKRELIVTISPSPDDPMQSSVYQRQHITIYDPEGSYACDFNG